MIYKLTLFVRALSLERTIERLQRHQATEVRRQYYNIRRSVPVSQAKADFIRAKYELKIRDLRHEKNSLLRKISFAS